MVVKPLHQRRWVQLFAILIMVFAVYGNSIQNGYNVDDGYIVPLDSANPLPAEGVSAIFKILSSPYNDVAGMSYGYRPLGKISMAIEYELWGNDPQKSHTVNLILYALNIFILLLFLERVAALCGFKNYHVLYIALLIFLVHPIHTEVVCSIKNREEMLSFIFVLSGLLVFFKWHEAPKRWHLGLFVILLTLGLFAKLTTFNIIGLFALILVFRNLKYGRSVISRQLFKDFFTGKGVLFLFLSIVIFYMIGIILPGYIVTEDITTRLISLETDPYQFADQISKIPIAFQTIWFYLKKLIIPAPLLFYYGYDMLPLIGWGHPIAYLGVILSMVVMALVIYGLSQRKWVFTIWWLLFFVITIFPFSNFGFRYVTGIVGERLVYQASLSFGVIVALGIVALAELTAVKMNLKRWSAPRLSYLMSGVIIIPFLVLTVQRNTDWKDKLTLYKNDIVHLERSARANRMMANSFMKEASKLRQLQPSKALNTQIQKHTNSARHYLNRAIDVSPEYSEAWFDLARIHAGYTGNSDSAIICLDMVSDQDPYYHVQALELLGDLYFRQKGKPNQAINYYRSAYLADPSNQGLYNKAMALAFQLGRALQDIAITDTAIARGFPEAYIDKGDIYWFDGDTIKAVAMYEQAKAQGIAPPGMIEKLEYYKGLN